MTTAEAVSNSDLYAPVRPCTNEREPDGELCTGVLTFGPNDQQAQCSVCGGWEGFWAPMRVEIQHLRAELATVTAERDKARAGCKRRADELERLSTGETCKVGMPMSCGDAHTAGHCVRVISQSERDAVDRAAKFHTKWREATAAQIAAEGAANIMEGLRDARVFERDQARAKCDRMRQVVEEAETYIAAVKDNAAVGCAALEAAVERYWELSR